MIITKKKECLRKIQDIVNLKLNTVDCSMGTDKYIVDTLKEAIGIIKKEGKE